MTRQPQRGGWDEGHGGERTCHLGGRAETEVVHGDADVAASIESSPRDLGKRLEETVVRHPDDEQSQRGRAYRAAVQKESKGDAAHEDRERPGALKQARQRVLAHPIVVVVKERRTHARKQCLGQDQEKLLDEEGEVESERVQQRRADGQRPVPRDGRPGVGSARAPRPQRSREAEQQGTQTHGERDRNRDHRHASSVPGTFNRVARETRGSFCAGVL